jgi:signal transduction histidine kinase
VAGFVVFLACALVELLVANRVIVFLAPADVGFLAVVVPMSFLQLRRFIEDAGRLHALSGRLAGEVRERTEERDRAELALVEAERLAALGRLAAGVGHEINNPLTYMQLALDDVDEHLAASGASERARQSLADARDGAWRIQKVVEGLRMYSRRQDERRPLDPADVARAALKVAHPHLRHVARIESRLEPTPHVLGDEPRLVQAIVNLLTNAAQAVAERQGAGRIALAVRRCGGDVALEVEDDGAGLPEADRGRLLEPYFTTRAARGGLGLGLFVTQGIADAHGGRVEFEPLEPRGTRVRIVLPALEPGATPPPAPTHRGARPPEPRGPRPRLLIVDDEPLVLRVLSQGLAPRWDVTCADGGAAAVRLLQGGAFDAVVCDLLMPGTSGMALAEHVAMHHPRLRPRMVFLTGGAVTPEAQAFLEGDDVSVLSKPVRLDELESRLHDTIGAR